MAARPEPRFFKVVGRNTVNVPFNFYTNSGGKMTLEDLNNPMVQPYNKNGLEVVIKKLRPNEYQVEELEDQNELENANLNAKVIENVGDPNLLGGPKKLTFRLPPGMGGNERRRKSRRTKRKSRRATRKANRKH